jgi:hypothetical protein
MDSRRLVVWIAAGVLGFQGGTLVLDLLNCSVLSWLYVRRHGLELSTPAPAMAQKQPVGGPLPRVGEGGIEAAPAGNPSLSESQSHRGQAPNASGHVSLQWIRACSAPQRLPPQPLPRRPLIPPASSVIGPAAASMPPSARGSASSPGWPLGDPALESIRPGSPRPDQQETAGDAG